MTLLLIDGFDEAGNLLEKYARSSSVVQESTVVRGGTGKSIKIPTSSSYYIEIPVQPTASELYFGCGVRIGGFVADLIKFYGDSATNVSITNPQCLAVKDANSGYIPMDSFSLWSYDTWHYLEVKIIVSDSSSSGDVKVRVDGIERYSSGTGEDFKSVINTDSNTHKIRLYGDNDLVYYDDLYVCDSSGSINNTFLGPVKVETKYADGNGTTSNFTGSDADSTNNYLHIDDADDNDGDTSYVESSTTSHIDLYTFANIATTGIDTIHGVAVNICSKKDDSGTRTGKPICRSGSTNYEGAEFAPDTDYAYSHNVWEEDPDTSTAWTATGVNSAEFGVKIET